MLTKPAMPSTIPDAHSSLIVGTPMIQHVAHGEITHDNDIEILPDKVIEMEMEPMPPHSGRSEVQAIGPPKP